MDGLLAEMSSAQLNEWRAFARLEPFGSNEAEWRMGQVMALVAEVYRDRDKRADPYMATDFMRDFEKPILYPEEEAEAESEPVSQERVEKKFMTAMRAFGGRASVKKRNKK